MVSLPIRDGPGIEAAGPKHICFNLVRSKFDNCESRLDDSASKCAKSTARAPKFTWGVVATSRPRRRCYLEYNRLKVISGDI